MQITTPVVRSVKNKILLKNAFCNFLIKQKDLFEAPLLINRISLKKSSKKPTMCFLQEIFLQSNIFIFHNNKFKFFLITLVAKDLSKQKNL